MLTLRGRTVVPVLLLLLLHDSLAEEVCLNMTEHNIIVTVDGSTVWDDYNQSVKCTKAGNSCYFHCTHNNSMSFTGSSDCFDVNVTTYPNRTEHLIHNYTSCTEAMCVAHVMQPLVRSLHCDDCNLKEVTLLYKMQDACSNLFSENPDVKFDFIKVENQLFHNIMGASSIEPGSSKTHNLMISVLKVINISETSLRPSKDEASIKLEAPLVLPENIAFIQDVRLPLSALRELTTHKRIVGLVTYKRHSHFQFAQEEIISKVFRIEVLGKQRLRNLKPRISMTFNITTHTNIENDTQLLCRYFDEEAVAWKPSGCETIESANANNITCLCDHATAFAVLLMRTPIAEIHWKILSYISYIGCGLSAFFTALSLVIYVFSRSHKLDYSISIHISLSGALFLLNTTFLLTEWGASAGQGWLCVFVAAFMHYSLLCCFTWMAIEALHLYLLLVKVYNAYYKHYLLKLSLGGWGVPGIIVAVSVGMKDFKQFYGLTEITMADTNQTSSICWITDDSFFYSLNLLYFTLIFVFNLGILVAVASNICRMKQVLKGKSKPGADREKFSASCRSGLTVLGLTCLMGTTWGLAFLGSGYVNYPILYLFCILNSTQGFFIFLWICLSARSQRRRIMEDRMTSTPVKTSGVKSE